MRHIFSPAICFSSVLSWILFLSSICDAKIEIEPIAVPVGTDWFGYDGKWSPVNIRVGSPPQWVSVLPSTGSEETWVVGRYGCDGTFECRNLRGGLFEPNISSTWENVGFYALDMDANLGFSGYGDYGFDNIALNQYIVSPHQVIGIVNSTDYWLGYLGLGIRSINFTNDNELTYLSTLVENQSYIPSHSYGYTAGAYYRLKQVPSSLTLGGVDTNRFVPNNVTFALAPEQVPVVALNALTVKADPLSTSTKKVPWSANPYSLLGSGSAELFTIDSSTPFLWMPETVCDTFADAFGLTYNDTLELYTFEGNATAHDTLVNWNMTFTFTIADLPGSTNSIEITLPYDAFDLQLSYPYPGFWANASSPALNYFPLKRAANDTQYTIGRLFLQESYLTVDYERNNFSISQAKFALDSLTNTNIVGITRPKNSTLAGPIGVSDGSSGISKGAIAGIAVGAALIIALLIGGAFIFIRRRRSRRPSSETSLDKLDPNLKKKKRRRRRGKFLYRLLGAPSDVQPTEMPADKYHPAEVPADSETSRFELAATTPIELPGSDPSSYNTQTSTKDSSHGRNLSAYDAAVRKLGSSHDRRGPPAELSHSNSTTKLPEGGYYAPQQSSSPNLPAYTPSQMRRQSSPHAPLNDPNSPGPSPGFSTISPPTGSPAERRRTGLSDNISLNSSQLTSPMLSPLTPLTPSRAGVPPGHSSGLPSPYISNTDSNNNSATETRSSLGLGLSNQMRPTRTASRGSRFIEEGISSSAGSTATSDDLFRDARELHRMQTIAAAEEDRRLQRERLALMEQERELERERELQRRQQQQHTPATRLEPETEPEAPRRFSWEE